MKIKWFSFFLLFSGLLSFGQESYAEDRSWKLLMSFIPKGYDTLDGGLVWGDINNDNSEDAILALHSSIKEESDEEAKRLLLVLLKTPSGYKIAGRSSEALLCKGCGDIYGDPWLGISIDKGVLSVSHYGGSAWRWSDVQKFRYQKEGIYLIGSTLDTYLNTSDCNGEGVGDAGRTFRDTNWVTGDEEYIKRDDECKLIAHTRKKIKRKPLQKLEQYKGS